mgnify:CR=1 FL=1
MSHLTNKAPWYPIDPLGFKIDYDVSARYVLSSSFIKIAGDLEPGGAFRIGQAREGVETVVLGVVRFKKPQSFASCIEKMGKAYMNQANIWELGAYCRMFKSPLDVKTPEGCGIVACHNLYDVINDVYKVPIAKFISDDNGLGRRLGLLEVGKSVMGCGLGFLVRIPWLNPEDE